MTRQSTERIRAHQSARPRSYEGGPLALWDQWRTFVQARPSPFFPIKKSRVPASSLPGIGLAPIAEKIHAVQPQISTPRRYLPSSFPACLAPHTRAYLLQDPSFAISSSSSASASPTRPGGICWRERIPSSPPASSFSSIPLPFFASRTAPPHAPHSLSLYVYGIRTLTPLRSNHSPSLSPPIPFYLIRIAAPGLTPRSPAARSGIAYRYSQRLVQYRQLCHISRTTLAIPGPRPSLDHAHLFAHCYLASISHLLFRIQSTAWQFDASARTTTQSIHLHRVLRFRHPPGQHTKQQKRVHPTTSRPWTGCSG